MFGKLLIVAAGLLLGGAAVAQEPPAQSGRFQIAPDGDGFVRLDTETGTLSHCNRSEGVWRCIVVSEERTEVDRRLLALESEVAALKEALEEIDKPLATVQEDDVVVASPSPPREELLDEEEREFDEALSFAERMMRRFFDMIRELKDEESSQKI
jgi:hypothetical protein